MKTYTEKEVVDALNKARQDVQVFTNSPNYQDHHRGVVTHAGLAGVSFATAALGIDLNELT